LHIFDPRIHWFSLINSAVILIFLTGMVAMILLRALHKDIARYNALDFEEDVQEESGWKLVHGDVFRPPKHSLLLSVLLGSGAQLFMMVGCTTSTLALLIKSNLVFALLGFLSPSNRGALGTAMIILYFLFGFIGGFVSSQAYKGLGGENWKMNIILTPVLVPGYPPSFFLC
jgi:transmembrane 9 superfamily member 2/4